MTGPAPGPSVQVRNAGEWVQPRRCKSVTLEASQSVLLVCTLRVVGNNDDYFPQRGKRLGLHLAVLARAAFGRLCLTARLERIRSSLVLGRLEEQPLSLKVCFSLSGY